MPNLYIVATPIGNLKDITLRALEVLKSVDLILAEDTRVTRNLLAHYNISKPLLRFDAHVQSRTLDKLVDLLEEGKNLALITDAGTPGISDPGYWLNCKVVEWAEKQKTTQPFNNSTIQLIPIPGPSALAAIISASDIDLSNFTFFGFPPHKKGRQTLFKKIAKSEVPVILFESPHRILKTFTELYKEAGDRRINVGRELTKIYEEIWRGKLSEAREHFSGERERGEFVIVVDVPAKI